MSKWEKLILRIKDLDKNMRFAELKKILESYGYEMRSPSGGAAIALSAKKAEIRSLSLHMNQ